MDPFPWARSMAGKNMAITKENRFLEREDFMMDTS
jgi:hypothetical protein